MTDASEPKPSGAVVGHYASHPSAPQRVGSIEASTVMYVTKDASTSLSGNQKKNEASSL